MRILLLPVTAQRSIIYYQKLTSPRVHPNPRLDERLAAKASKFWSGFEKSDKRWKKAVVNVVGKLLDTIPFEESGLKSVPPRNTYMRTLKDGKSHISEKTAVEKGILHQLSPIELVYPKTSTVSPNFDTVHSVIGHYVASAFKTHRKQMLLCFLGLPLTIPFAINPLMPNFPGMYLLYRIWSNWVALKGAKHLHFLLQHHQLSGTTFPELDQAYKKNHGLDRMTSELAEEINSIFNDPNLYRELKQAVRQTAPHDHSGKKNRQQH